MGPSKGWNAMYLDGAFSQHIRGKVQRMSEARLLSFWAQQLLIKAGWDLHEESGRNSMAQTPWLCLGPYCWSLLPWPYTWPSLASCHQTAFVPSILEISPWEISQGDSAWIQDYTSTWYWRWKQTKPQSLTSKTWKLITFPGHTFLDNCLDWLVDLPV